MHWRESSVRKASNTAKLVPMLLEDGGIVAAGDVAAEARYVRCIMVTIALLYPRQFRFYDVLFPSVFPNKALQEERARHQQRV